MAYAGSAGQDEGGSGQEEPSAKVLLKRSHIVGYDNGPAHCGLIVASIPDRQMRQLPSNSTQPFCLLDRELLRCQLLCWQRANWSRNMYNKFRGSSQYSPGEIQMETSVLYCSPVCHGSHYAACSRHLSQLRLAS